MASAAPSLSIVLATAHPGPQLDTLLTVLLPQLAAVGGEVVLMDGSPHGLPTPHHDGVTVAHLRSPGDDVFAMRARGASAARGWVVAFAEDHCMPADDRWAAAVLDAHRRHGDRAAIAGAVRNGTPDTPWDRGSFLLTFASVHEPMAPGTWPSEAPPPPANISVKREVVDAHALSPGFLEFELLPHLAGVGHIIRAPEVRMAHHQSHSLRWFVTHHFHNGRATGGLVPGRAQGDRHRQIGGALLLVPRHLRRLLGFLRERDGGARAHRSAVGFAVIFLIAHAAGQLCGTLLGPGRSPAALE